MLAPHGLACDYRYGSVWITKTDKMKHWQDPTGIAEIKPPTGSALARSWNEPIAADYSAPLGQVLSYVASKLAISIDASRVNAISVGQPTPVAVAKTAFAPTGTIRQLPLRHLLGNLLYD